MTWDGSQGLGRVKKDSYRMNPFMKRSLNDKIKELEESLMVAKGPDRCVGSTRETFVATESVS